MLPYTVFSVGAMTNICGRLKFSGFYSPFLAAESHTVILSDVSLLLVRACVEVDAPI